jgi:hypothetical protein
MAAERINVRAVLVIIFSELFVSVDFCDPTRSQTVRSHPTANSSGFGADPYNNSFHTKFMAAELATNSSPIESFIADSSDLRNTVAIRSEDFWVLAKFWRRSMPAAVTEPKRN